MRDASGVPWSLSGPRARRSGNPPGVRAPMPPKLSKGAKPGDLPIPPPKADMEHIQRPQWPWNSTTRTGVWLIGIRRSRFSRSRAKPAIFYEFDQGAIRMSKQDDNKAVVGRWFTEF